MEGAVLGIIIGAIVLICVVVYLRWRHKRPMPSPIQPEENFYPKTRFHPERHSGKAYMEVSGIGYKVNPEKVVKSLQDQIDAMNLDEYIGVFDNDEAIMMINSDETKSKKIDLTYKVPENMDNQDITLYFAGYQFTIPVIKSIEEEQAIIAARAYIPTYEYSSDEAYIYWNGIGYKVNPYDVERSLKKQMKDKYLSLSVVGNDSAIHLIDSGLFPTNALPNHFKRFALIYEAPLDDNRGREDISFYVGNRELIIPVIKD